VKIGWVWFGRGLERFEIDGRRIVARPDAAAARDQIDMQLARIVDDADMLIVLAEPDMDAGPAFVDVGVLRHRVLYAEICAESEFAHIGAIGL